MLPHGTAPRTLRVLVLEEGTSLQEELLAVSRGEHLTANVLAPRGDSRAACDVCLVDAETVDVRAARRELLPRRVPMVAAARDPAALARALDRGAELHVARPLSEELFRAVLVKLAEHLPAHAVALCDGGRTLSTPLGTRVKVTPLMQAVLTLLLRAPEPVPASVIAKHAGKGAGQLANVARALRRMRKHLRPHGLDVTCVRGAYALREIPPAA